MAESSDINNGRSNLYPDISDALNADYVPAVEAELANNDKYIPSYSFNNETGETWNSQSTPFSIPDTMDYTNDTPSSNNSTKDDNKRENNTNQERRRNIRLQSGAGSDKYQNASRFPGGHSKANAERPKPQPCDTINIGSTGNCSPDYKSRDHAAGGQSSEHARQGRDRIQKETENYLFFWRKESPFSQWHPAKFTIDGLTFNCAEQYMMYNKAKFSKNEAELDAVILSLDDPGDMKSYGRSICDLDYVAWEEKREEIVKKGNMAKFSQNEKLREELVSTYPKLLVEASPHDQVWGIGLAADDPKIFDVNNWRGSNLLGKIITEVRDELLGDFLKPSV
ncbi:uncharacterized protein LOC134696776 [Mytilus trossulus]|uniref:uncharacterized protein LOC134696776 n=1 Tax=Mytilus trossulus TaxID=6551 RepID=UPI0030069EC1